MEGLEQVRALAHPLRLRLLELFAAEPRTTKQAAELLGEAPTRLYHHVAALEQAGLIRLRETRPSRGATEKYFEAVAHRYETEPGVAVKAGARDRAAMGFVVFDQARQELVKALTGAEEQLPENLMAVRSVLRLSPRAAKQLKKDLLAILTKLREGKDQTPGTRSRRARRRYSLTLALIPADEAG
jgi:DNA-binding transcriptional ArsR family regulator